MSSAVNPKTAANRNNKYVPILSHLFNDICQVFLTESLIENQNLFRLEIKSFK